MKRLQDGDKAAHLITLIFAASVFLVTVFLIYELWIHSSASRAKFGLGFLFSKAWDPSRREIRSACLSSTERVVTSLLALLISVPLGGGRRDFLVGTRSAQTFQHLHFPGGIAGRRA